MTPDAPPSRTPWEVARALHAEGKSRAEIAKALADQALDPESMTVLLNALPDGPAPHALPAPNLELRIDPLAPRLLSLTELGLAGDARTTGLYWLAFGGVLALVVGLVLGVTAVRGFEAEDEEALAAWAFATFTVLPWVGFGAAGLAIVRGAALWFSAVRLRRK